VGLVFMATASLGLNAVPLHKADDIGQLVTNTSSHLVVRNADPKL
jgi:hypothetical protein